MRADISPFPAYRHIDHFPQSTAAPTQSKPHNNPLPQQETAVNLHQLQHTLAADRARVLKGSAFSSHLRRISPEKFKDLIEAEIRQNPTEQIHPARILERNGFSKTLSNIHFSDKDFPTLKGMNLNGITFNKCTFNWSHLSASKVCKSKIHKTEIADCNFVECKFKNVSFMNALVRGSTFTKCHFNKAMFLNTALSQVVFRGSHFENSSFEDAQLSECRFERATMPGTHFLKASISKCKILDSDLTNTVFCGNEKAFLIDGCKIVKEDTKPTTVTLVPAEARGISVPLVGEKIAGIADTVPVRVAMQGAKSTRKEVAREVKKILSILNNTWAPPGESIPQRLLKVLAENPEKYPHARAIVDKAKSIAQEADSVVLPGGEDIPPHFYGEKSHGSQWDGDYRRALMEIALIDQCFHKGIPLMSICRGYQMTAVYFGAKLYQDIGKGQVGVRILEERISEIAKDAEQGGILKDILKELRVALYHHQAVINMPLEHMTVPLTRSIKDGEYTYEIAMAIESKSGAPMIGLQFHPEFLEKLQALLEDPDLTNERLEEFGNSYVRPGTNRTGLQNPTDMVASGILNFMSPANDKLWNIVGDSAKARLEKASITDEALAQGRNNLHEPGNRIWPRQGLWGSAKHK